jgi:hypothetical protein
LFGLYGALGGLVAVLLLGELLWALLHPAPSVLAPLTIAVPSAVTVYPGSQNTVTVKIARNNFEGPVRLEAVDLPAGVEVTAATIAADETQAELAIKADGSAGTAHHQVKLRASSPGGANAVDSESFRVTVLPPPPTLKLTASPAVTVYAGDINRVKFRIARRQFESAVRLEVLDLPADLTVPLVTLPAKATEGTLEVSARKEARPGLHRLRVEARSLADHKVVDLGTVNLTVEPKPGKLRMTVAPKITVFAGNRNKLTVLIARHEFKEPVRLEVEGLQGGVDIAAVDIPADKNEATLEVNASKLGPDVRLNWDLTVRASVPTAKDIVDARPVKLHVEPHPPKLNLSVSPQVTVFAGDKNRFTVQVARGDFNAEVKLEVDGAPAGVQVLPVTIPADRSDATLEVDASRLSAKTPAAAHELRVRARANTAEEIAASGKLQLKVEPHPGKLTMTVSPRVTVFPGDSNQFTVRIARGDFKGPVRVEARDVPAGVLIPAVTIPDGQADATLVVNAKALDREKSVSQKLSVVAKAEVPGEDITATGVVQLQIEPPPPTLQLSAPPVVKVYPGGKARFSVKVERHRYQGPLVIAATGPGAADKSITVANLTLAANAKDGELEVSASVSSLFQLGPQAFAWQVTARAPDGKGPVAAQAFQLKLETPDSELKLSVSDTVEVHQGAKCKFMIKVARGGFRGPVKVEFTGVPDGVMIPETLPGTKAPEVVLQAVDTEKVVDGWALIRAPVGKHTVKVKATALAAAPDKKVPTADRDFVLDVKPLDPSKRPAPLDVVFVLDVTDSMDKQIKGVRDGVGQFIKGLRDNEMPARVGLVAFRDINYPEFQDFRVLKFNGGKDEFTEDFKEFSAEVDKLQAEGGGDTPESSLDAI